MYLDELESAANKNQNFEKPTEQLPEPPAKESTTISDIRKHPDDDLDVDAMIVADLRVELRKRGLDTKGRKRELQARLLAYLQEAKEKREKNQHCKPNTESSKSYVSEIESEKQVKFGEAKTDDSEKEDDGMHQGDRAHNIFTEDANNEDSQLKPAKDDPPEEPKKQAPKSAIKPSKYSNPVLTKATQYLSQTNAEPTKSNFNAHNDCHITANSNSNSSGQYMSITPFTKSTLLSTPSGNRTKVGTVGSAKEMMKKKFDDNQSARKAKLEEIRNQSARKAKLEEIRNKV